MIGCATRGHGLVVERVLAKDETGVRFSLPALLRSVRKQSFAVQAPSEVALRSRIGEVGQYPARV